MKRIVVMIVCIGALLCLCACGAEVVTKTPVSTEYVPAYDAMEMVYEYKYDWLNGEFKYLPNIKQVHHEEVFKVQYKIAYSDGSEETRWEDVDKETYEEAEKALKEREGKG